VLRVDSSVVLLVALWAAGKAGTRVES
jgi:hypothetical protein